MFQKMSDNFLNSVQTYKNVTNETTVESL